MIGALCLARYALEQHRFAATARANHHANAALRIEQVVEPCERFLVGGAGKKAALGAGRRDLGMGGNKGHRNSRSGRLAAG
jgi:hypothetical protein